MFVSYTALSFVQQVVCQSLVRSVFVGKPWFCWTLTWQCSYCRLFKFYL